jgi:hypothetical protein
MKSKGSIMKTRGSQHRCIQFEDLEDRLTPAAILPTFQPLSAIFTPVKPGVRLNPQPDPPAPTASITLTVLEKPTLSTTSQGELQLQERVAMEARAHATLSNSFRAASQTQRSLVDRLR